MLDKRHYIDLVDGEFKETSRGDLTELFRAIEAPPTPDHVVIHFHGGLVDRAATPGIPRRRGL